MKLSPSPVAAHSQALRREAVSHRVPSLKPPSARRVDLFGRPVAVSSQVGGRAAWPPGLLEARPAADKSATASDDPLLRYFTDPDYDSALAQMPPRPPISLGAHADGAVWDMVDDIERTRSRSVQWGEERFVDALRLRRMTRLRSAVGDPDEPAHALGVLTWLGHEAARRHIAIAGVPQRTAQVLIAAIAAAHGYAEALNHANEMFDRRTATPALAHWMAVLAMRSIFESGFSIDAQPWLVAMQQRPQDVSTWTPPAAIALRQLAGHNDDTALVFLISAVCQAVFATSLAGAAMARGYHLTEDTLPDAFSEHANADATNSVIADLMSERWSPWDAVSESGSGVTFGVDVRWVEWLVVTAMRSSSPATIWPIFLDRSLLRAVMFETLGRTADAHHQLTATVRHGLSLDAERRVLAAFGRQLPWPTAVSRAVNTTQTDAIARIHGTLSELPEPSVSTGTPVWILDRLLADLGPLMAGAGKLAQYRHVRMLLGRKDSRVLMAPYWLLTDENRPDFDDALRLMRQWVGYPRTAVWQRFLGRRGGQLVGRPYAE